MMFKRVCHKHVLPCGGLSVKLREIVLMEVKFINLMWQPIPTNLLGLGNSSQHLLLAFMVVSCAKIYRVYS
jgi:hypothetical protein